MKLLKQLILISTMVAGMGVAHAGPILISGTDSDDHGSVAAGVNQDGWKFLQLGISQIGGAVTNGQKKAVCIGCNGNQAQAAFDSAYGLSGLGASGWSSVILNSASDIAMFFDGTGATKLANAGMIYMPTVANNVGGGITDTQLAAVNGQGALINSFLSTGGGLFSQEQANSAIGYGWLTSLLPTFTVKGDGHGGVANSSAIQLTAQGQGQFPTLTNADLQNATPWHAFFKGGFGALQVLAVGNGDNSPQGALDDAVVLGGGFAGGGGVIVCGGPNQPSCDVPEPNTLPLTLLALGCFVALRLKRQARK
jgi:hypothetical protein